MHPVGFFFPSASTFYCNKMEYIPLSLFSLDEELQTWCNAAKMYFFIIPVGRHTVPDRGTVFF